MWNDNKNQNNNQQRYQQPQQNQQWQQGGQLGYGAWQQQMGGYAMPYETSVAERSSLARKVMAFTFFSILAAMAGAYVGASMNLRFGLGAWIIIMVVEIGLIFAAAAFKDKMPLNFILLYAFAAVTGLAISPVIDILATAGYQFIIYQALGVTAGLTLALTAYAWTTKRDFSGFAPYLFVAVIGLMIVGVLNIFIRSEFLYMIYLYAGVLIFSFYLIFDVQQVKKYPDTVGNAVMLALGIYLNIYNLFLFILQLLMSFNRD
jgi:FtsH-binding integral membrane protein